jgi:hypothetical protein
MADVSKARVSHVSLVLPAPRHCPQDQVHCHRLHDAEGSPAVPKARRGAMSYPSRSFCPRVNTHGFQPLPASAHCHTPRLSSTREGGVIKGQDSRPGLPSRNRRNRYTRKLGKTPKGQLGAVADRCKFGRRPQNACAAASGDLNQF